MNSQATMSRPIAEKDRDSNPLQKNGNLQPADDLVDYVTTYARENPGTAALWCFGVGFIVGWKLKPW